MNTGIKKLNRQLSRTRSANRRGGSRYVRQRSEENAIKAMELAFDKEKWDDSVARQQLTDKRATERHDWAETNKRIDDIGAMAAPLLQTFKDPLDIEPDEMKELKKSIDAFSAESRYARTDVERAEYAKQHEALNQIYNTTSDYQSAVGDISSIRASINNLIGEYKDKTGMVRQGEFNIKNTSNIIKNIETALATHAEIDNQKIIEILEGQRKTATQANFVANQLKKYPKEHTFVNKAFGEVIQRARDAVESEDLNLAYDLLSRPGQADEAFEQVLGIRTKANEAKALDDARRIQADHNLGIIKSAITDKETGNLSAELQAIATFDTTKTNYLGNPQDWQKYDMMMHRLLNRIHKEDKRWFDSGNPFKGGGGSDVLKSKHAGIADDKEAQFLLLSGRITKKDGHYVWPSGSVYMLNTGGEGFEKVEGNQPGEFHFDANRWQNHITDNLEKLSYGDLEGDKNKIRYSVAAAANLWLDLNPEIENRRLTTSDSVRNTPENLKSDDLIGNINAHQETIKSVSSGKAPTSDLVGIVGDGNVLSAMRSLENTNAKFLIEFPDGSEEYIRAKEWGAIRGLHSDSAQVKGMKIKAVTNVKGVINPDAPIPEKKLSWDARQNLSRAKKKLARNQESLTTAKTDGQIAHYEKIIKETQDLIARIESKK